MAVSISSPTSSDIVDRPIDFSVKPVRGFSVSGLLKSSSSDCLQATSCLRQSSFDDHHRLPVVYNPQMPHLSHTSFGGFPHLLNPLFTANLMSHLANDESRKLPRESASDLRHNHSPTTHVSSSTSDSDSPHSGERGEVTNDRHHQVIVRNETVKRKKEVVKDDAYWERRRKNNDAAKRSRDSRRQKEDDMALRAALLEQENIRLRLQLEQLRAETDRLRLIVLNPAILAIPQHP